MDCKARAQRWLRHTILCGWARGDLQPKARLVECALRPYYNNFLPHAHDTNLQMTAAAIAKIAFGKRRASAMAVTMRRQRRKEEKKKLKTGPVGQYADKLR